MSDVVPEFVDPPAPARPLHPRPFRRFTWLLALPLLPFAPRRLGVRFSAMRWPAAIAAHVMCILVAYVMVEHIDARFHEALLSHTRVVMPSFGPQASVPPVVVGSHLDFVERVQIYVTSAINRVYQRTNGRGDIYAILAIPFATHALCWLWALLAMPYVAVGERMGLLRSRMLKLSLFSSVVLPFTAAAAAVVTHIGLTYPSQFEFVTWQQALSAMAVIGAACWLNIIIRMGRLYAGPPQGPAWQPVRPRCLACGYVLTGLPRDGDCPECGLTIDDSLGENRAASAWAAARKLLDQPSGWLRTSLAVFRDPNFFRRLDVTGGTSKAIDFAGLSSAFPAAVFAAGGLAVGIFGTESPPTVLAVRVTYTAFLTLAAFCGARLVFFAVLSLIGLLVGFRPGVDPRAVTVAVCYSSVRLLPVWAAFIAIAILPDFSPSGVVYIPQIPIRAGTLLMLIPIILLLRVALQIRKSVREVAGAASR